MERRIALGSDHGGVALKQELLAVLEEQGLTCVDVGCAADASVDYPDYATIVADAVRSGDVELGILCCGSGIGMSIAANKIPGIRAALCHDPYSAKMSRQHNNANILCLGGRVIGPELAKSVVQAFIEGTFAGDRHQRRLDKITALERNG